MSDWRTSLDRWLTEPPEDAFGNWHEDVMAHQITHEFYSRHEALLEDPHPIIDGWLDSLYYKEKSPSDAARILMRAITLYKITK